MKISELMELEARVAETAHQLAQCQLLLAQHKRALAEDNLVRWAQLIESFCQKTHVSLGCFQAVDHAMNNDQSIVFVTMRADADTEHETRSLLEFASIIKKFKKGNVTVEDVHVLSKEISVEVNHALYDNACFEDFIYTNESGDELFSIIVYFKIEPEEEEE